MCSLDNKFTLHPGSSLNLSPPSALYENRFQSLRYFHHSYTERVITLTISKQLLVSIYLGHAFINFLVTFLYLNKKLPAKVFQFCSKIEMIHWHLNRKQNVWGFDFWLLSKDIRQAQFFINPPKKRICPSNLLSSFLYGKKILFLQLK